MSSLGDDLSTTCSSLAIASPVRNDINAHLGSIGKFVRREINLAKRALPDQPPQRVVSYGSKVFGREFSVTELATDLLTKVVYSFTHCRSSL